MGEGTVLVKAHLDSFLAGRTADYEQQLAPTFRYIHIPEITGAGPDHARRWRDTLFSIYRDWRVEVEDGADDDVDVIVRLKFMGADPTDPSMPATCASTALLHYVVEDDRIVSCNALHMAFEQFGAAVREMAEQQPQPRG